MKPLIDRFAAAFGRRPVAAARAPGRVNLIGEHTDYCQGWVLPCAIDRDTWVVAAPRQDGVFRAISREQESEVAFRLDDLQCQGDWGDYPRAVVAALREAGIPIPGSELAIASELPLGSGLSSSAALCVGLVTALGRLSDARLAPARVAALAHRAENGFVGVPCGIMDGTASALGKAGHAVLLDCRSEAVRHVDLGDDASLVVVHSGVTRRLLEGDYGDRRAECERALDEIRSLEAGAGVGSLRDLDLERFERLAPRLSPISRRRVRHVVSENARVGAFVRALEGRDSAAAGQLLCEGMRSLQQDYEVSVPELDALCAIGDSTPGVYGSRLTGAGFGGCTLHWVDRRSAASAASAIADGFAARFGRRPPVETLRPADGASAVSI